MNILATLAFVRWSQTAHLMHYLVLFSEGPIKEMEEPTPSKLEFGHLFVLNSPGMCVVTNIISWS